MGRRIRWLRTHVDMRFVIGAFCLLCIAATWGFVFSKSQSEQVQAVAHAVRQNSNLAKVFEEHTLRTVRGVDAAALFIAGEYARLGSRIDLNAYVADGRIDGTLFENIYVVDANGDVVTSQHPFQPGNMRDMEHFRVHVANAAEGVFISKPMHGGAANQWIIHLSRRITRSDGSFGGIVSMVLDPAYFTRFFHEADLGKLGLVGLSGFDGVSRARQKGDVASFGEDVSQSTALKKQLEQPSGDYLSKGRVDGVVRYLSYRVVPGYPLVVIVGMAQDEVLADYVRKRNSDYWVATLFSLVVVLFGSLLMATLARQARAVQELERRESQFRATFNQAAIGISHTGLDGRILQVNQKLCDLLGYSREELMALSWQQITHPADLPKSQAFNDAQLRGEAVQTGLEKRYLHKDGSAVWVNLSTALVCDSRGRPDYFVKMVEGISERKQMQQNLQHLVNHDGLTGLPNRDLFYDRLEHALSQAARRDWITGVMFIDLDQFKLINDTLGHGVGDELLRQAARRLLQCVRDDDTVGRLGGDEFAVVLSELMRDEDASIVARKVIATLAVPFLIDNNEIFMTASIGIACSLPDASMVADSLMAGAQAAMQDAKQAGKNNYRFYTPGTNERAQKRIQLEKELRQAVSHNELVLHYQPKTNLASGNITGVEALLRWQRPGGGLVPPYEFIPLLEETGLIVQAGEWVVRTACAQINAWRAAGVEPVAIAVNLSAKQFHQQDICAMVSRALQDHKVEPCYLELEITESAAMQNADQTAITLRQLKELGLRISIDDFGTGYSSLAYLKRFPIDSLKIDRSFVAELPGNKDDASIAKAVITMAHALRLKVIAEGVENAAQLDFLALNGCDEMQGYYFSRPIAAPQCTEMLQQRHKLLWSPVLE